MKSIAINLTSRLGYQTNVFRPAIISLFLVCRCRALAAQEPSVEPSIKRLVSYFRSFCIVSSIIRITGVIKRNIDIQTQIVEVMTTLPYDDVFATIKKTGKEVCYLSYTMSIDTHSLLGCGWERGKSSMAKRIKYLLLHYIASGSTRGRDRLITCILLYITILDLPM